MRWASTLASVALVVGCTVSASAAHVSKEGHTVVELHGDVDFSMQERQQIERAAEMWFAQTGGYADIRLVWDLDFNSAESVKAHHNHGMLARFTSDLDLIKKMDNEEGGKQVLGFVAPGHGVNSPTGHPIRMGLVADRLGGKAWVQVTIHEFGHVFGIQHTPRRESVMVPGYTRRDRSCMDRQDLESFCAVRICDRAKLLPCE
jgi:hypothetical protein